MVYYLATTMDIPWPITKQNIQQIAPFKVDPLTYGKIIFCLIFVIKFCAVVTSVTLDCVKSVHVTSISGSSVRVTSVRVTSVRITSVHVTSVRVTSTSISVLEPHTNLSHLIKISICRQWAFS